MNTQDPGVRHTNAKHTLFTVTVTVLALTLTLTLCACAPGKNSMKTDLASTGHTSQEASKDVGDSDTKESEAPTSNDTADSTEDSSATISAGHWYGIALASADLDNISKVDKGAIYLDIEDASTGTLAFHLNDDVYESQFVQIEDYDGELDGGGTAVAFATKISSIPCVGFMNDTTCLMLCIADPSYNIFLSKYEDTSTTDLKLEFGTMSAVTDNLESIFEGIPNGTTSSNGASESTAKSSASSASSSSSASKTQEAPKPSAPSATTGERNAAQSARDYIKYVGGFSRSGMIEQLLYEGFSQSEAEYGADNCGADWYEQAEKSAQDYMNYVGGFSRSSLIEQLEFEGFTHDQAEHGASAVGY